MKSNGLLTFLFYALLGLLVIAGGYQACKMRKEKADLAKQDAEMKKYWNDMGSPAAADTTSGSSTYAGGETTTPSTTTGADANGIEDTDAKPSAAAAPKSAAPSASTTAPAPSAKPSAAAPVQAPKTAATPTTTAPKLAPKTTSTTTAASKGNGTAGLGSGRYSVRVGSFGSIENARTQLEKVIRLGYPNATIGKTNGGKFSTVVVYKSNDRAAAVRVMDKLEAQGVDALVHDGAKEK
ncbi:MAG TPA: SPOR domain-containing protein [Saprospiraceae bacterium]|nr:SPOR domain-containing protein [Saprospiraceae bacterium]HND87683.1 SPOR domain-containing protein [Saprospiraceae bacterium]